MGKATAAITHDERIGKALKLLKNGLGPFVERAFVQAYGDQAAAEAARALGDDPLNAEKPMKDWDAAALLRIMWLSWHDVFKRSLGHAERSLLSELRVWRTKWAHQEEFPTDDAYRVLDSVARILKAISAPQAAEVEEMKVDLLRVQLEEHTTSATRQPTFVYQGGVQRDTAPDLVAPATGDVRIDALWVPGTPSTYANGSREASWKGALSEAIPTAPSAARATGVTADFVLHSSDWSRKGNDLDNLCEPLFSVLINKKGWVGGRRPNLEWYRVSKKAGDVSGCMVGVRGDSPALFRVAEGTLIVDGVYSGELPSNARDSVLAVWVASHRLADGAWDNYDVLLQFRSAALNIGDIATGRVKAVVDSLHPILGENPNERGDWRITTLQVEKGVDLPGVLQVTVWGHCHR